jgi:hypothetical protein
MKNTPNKPLSLVTNTTANMQVFFDSQECTCRYDILNKWNIPDTCLHRLLVKYQPTTFTYANKYYYLLSDINDMMKGYELK